MWNLLCDLLCYLFFMFLHRVSPAASVKTPPGARGPGGLRRGSFFEGHQDLQHRQGLNKQKNRTPKQIQKVCFDQDVKCWWWWWCWWLLLLWWWLLLLWWWWWFPLFFSRDSNFCIYDWKGPACSKCWNVAISVRLRKTTFRFGRLSNVSFDLGESFLALATFFLEPLTVTSAPSQDNDVSRTVKSCQGAQVQIERIALWLHLWQCVQWGLGQMSWKWSREHQALVGTLTS